MTMSLLTVKSLVRSSPCRAMTLTIAHCPWLGKNSTSTSIISQQLSFTTDEPLRVGAHRQSAHVASNWTKNSLSKNIEIRLHHTRCFSTSASSSGNSGDSGGKRGGIRGWMEDRGKKKEHERYMEQMERLSSMDRLTLGEYQKELERGLGSWGANVPSFLQTKEIKIAKEVAGAVQSLVDVVGKDATAEDLLEMDRLQRLKVATASKKTVEEVAILISQIQNMDLMQRTLKKRRLEGKTIPQDMNSMQAAIKKDALSVMTKAQKDLIKSRQQDLAKRRMRKRW